MGNTFITENFLLSCDQAIALYHDYARDLPIIDYHCHLPPQQIAEDTKFDNLTQAWLYGDHYKWRAMRAAGVPEEFCTGDATDWDKFQKWAETVPLALRNPLYHWTHLELKRPFGVDDCLLGPDTARSVYDRCNARLAEDEFSCRGIMRQMNVVLVCTTDDPTDTLEHHAVIADDASFDIQVLPTFRPDPGMTVLVPERFNQWVERLCEVSNVDVKDEFELYLEAIRQRHDFFHSMGCRLSDHGVKRFPKERATGSELDAIFRRIRRGNELRPEEVLQFKTAMLHEFAVMDHEKGWTQQFHIGALRNNNTRQFEALGPDVGCDSIGDFHLAEGMSRFLDRLDQEGHLTRTIAYNLNPAQNEVLATMLANFQDGLTRGKMQYGSGWWFLDQKDGIERQIETLSNQGLLGTFVGMLTDSRSFLSYPRHEYFRRILCNILGSDMQAGLLPNDMALVGKLVQNICYHNAAGYFGFQLPERAEG